MNPILHSEPTGLADEVLVAALADIPGTWALTPVKDKRALRPHWQTEPPLHHGYLAHQLLNGTLITLNSGQEYTQTWNGFGLRTGNPSHGLIGIDVDGPNAEALLHQLSHNDLPETVSWTSGKAHRVNRLYQLPDDLQAKLNDWTGKKFIGTAGDDLHFRYNQQQQVLPPSVHPETGYYRWINSPDVVAIAPAPTWLIQHIESWITPSKATTPQTKISPSFTPGAWPTLPPIAITGPGETNNCLRQLANWGYNTLGKTNPDDLGDYITEYAPKLPGWAEFASHESRKDLDKNWGYRWAKSCCNYWSSPRAQHHRQAPDTQWQNWLQEDSLGRLQWCTNTAKAIDKKFPSLRQAIRYLSDIGKEKFGKAFSNRTFWKYRSLWENLVASDPSSLKSATPEPQTLELTDNPSVEIDDPGPEVPNGSVRYRLVDKESEVLPDFCPSMEPEPNPVERSVLLPSAVHPIMIQPAPEPIEYRRGDRVIIDDWTHLPYCGKVAVVQARVYDPLGYRCYRLNIDYQGRFGTRGRKFEALPHFLRPAPLLTSAAQEPPSFLKATTDQLRVVLGALNPFAGDDYTLWQVTPAQIGQDAFQRLWQHLSRRHTVCA